MLDTKGDTEETQLNYFFCGSTIGVFELYVASFETMHTVYSFLTYMQSALCILSTPVLS